MTESDGGGDKGRRFRLGRRGRSSKDLFPGMQDDEVPDDWLATMGEDLRDGGAGLPQGGDEDRAPEQVPAVQVSPAAERPVAPERSPAAEKSPAAVVSQVMDALSDDMAKLEDGLSRLEETLSPPSV